MLCHNYLSIVGAVEPFLLRSHIFLSESLPDSWPFSLLIPQLRVKKYLKLEGLIQVLELLKSVYTFNMLPTFKLFIDRTFSY